VSSKFKNFFKKKNQTQLQFLAMILSFVLLTACTHATTVTDDYKEHFIAQTGLPNTRLVILVDGLSLQIFDRARIESRIPAITQYFSLDRSQPTAMARASFPTLTYPNLVSILTSQPVALHGISGNRIVKDGGELANFENIQDWAYLNQRLRGQTIYSFLKKREQNSVNFSYAFSDDMTAREIPNLRAGFDYAVSDYALVDAQTLESFANLLEGVPSAQWPEFLFVHLIGVDSLAHRFGPMSSEVASYITQLDARLKPIFDRLLQAENSGAKISAVLTADHGFTSISRQVSIREEVAALIPSSTVVEDNRIGSIYLPPSLFASSPSSSFLAKKRELAEALLKIPDIEWAMVKDGRSRIELFHHGHSTARIDFIKAGCGVSQWAARFQWQKTVPTPWTGAYLCLEDFDRLASLSNLNFVVPALVEYFAAAASPDLIVLPSKNADFSGAYLGNHGGLTAEEIFVPMLSHGETKPPGSVFPTWDLLRTLGLRP
jgi:predicted AlkP superfamily pyrophosphatase or phosphodiesterase